MAASAAKLLRAGQGTDSPARLSLVRLVTGWDRQGLDGDHSGIAANLRSRVGSGLGTIPFT